MPLGPSVRSLVTRSVVALAVALSAAACGGRSPDESRQGLYASSAELKQDSAATAAFFETVLADSVQRERLARAILRNEGMRRTMTAALLADSLAEVVGSGLPSWRQPPPPEGSAPAPASEPPTP